MLKPDIERSPLSESTIPPAGSLASTLNSWTQINLDDNLDENGVRDRVKSLICDIPDPWRTVELISPSAQIVVMDVLQQELDTSNIDEYRTVCMKCLRALSKARNIVPSSLFSQEVSREGENPIAGGGFADIWRGRLRDTQVCLKVLRIFIPKEDRAKLLRDFCQEALIWRQLRHPNVLPFLGVSRDLFAPSYCLISPWMVNGNIISYLEARPDHDRLASLVQVAEGMKYLHSLSPPIVHADIRGANILVTDDGCCCLADFGLSLFAESQALDSSSRISKGSIRWLAPEYIDSTLFDREYITGRDIYAYGCTILEVFTGKPPFSDIRHDAGIIHAVMGGTRPPRPPHHILQDGLWSLITACLSASPSQRPTAEQISKVLEDGDLLADTLSFTDGIFSPARRIAFTDIISIRADSPTNAGDSGFYIHRPSSDLGIPPDGLHADEGTDCNNEVYTVADARSRCFSASAIAATTTFGARREDASMPQPMLPQGFRAVAPRSAQLEQKQGSSPDASHEFKPILHRCPLCARDVQTVDIRQHLNELHHGYSQNHVKCTICGILLSIESYEDHVAQQHSGVQACCPYCRVPGGCINCAVYGIRRSRMPSDGSSSACTSEGGHGYNIGSTDQRTIVVEKNHQDLPFGLETNTGLPLQLARAPSVQRVLQDGPLASAGVAQPRTGRFDNLGESYGEKVGGSALAPPSTIPQTAYIGASNTSSRSSRSSADARSTANPSNSADAALTPNISFLPPSNFTAFQTDCSFTPNISGLPSFNSANAASTANSIIQYACNFAPNISAPSSYSDANAAFTMHTVQIGCNFTPNISIPPSYNTANAASMANSSFSLPLASTISQSRTNFAPNLSDSLAHSNSVNAAAPNESMSSRTPPSNAY